MHPDRSFDFTGAEPRSATNWRGISGADRSSPMKRGLRGKLRVRTWRMKNEQLQYFQIDKCRLDPGGVAAISRGLSAAIPHTHQVKQKSNNPISLSNSNVPGLE